MMCYDWPVEQLGESVQTILMSSRQVFLLSRSLALYLSLSFLNVSIDFLSSIDIGSYRNYSLCGSNEPN